MPPGVGTGADTINATGGYQCFCRVEHWGLGQHMLAGSFAVTSRTEADG